MLKDKKKNTNFFIVLLILFFDLVGFSLIFPVVPSLLEHYSQQSAPIDSWYIQLTDWLTNKPLWLNTFHSSTSTISLILIGGLLSSVYSFLQFISAPIWGRLSDRVGRRAILIATTFSLMIAYGIWFFSTSFTVFCLSRVLAGLAAGNLSVCSAAVADMTPRKQRTQSMGLVGATFGIGFLFGPPLGGLALLLPLARVDQPFAGLAIMSLLFASIGFFLSLLKFSETLKKQSITSRKTESPFMRIRKITALLKKKTVPQNTTELDGSKNPQILRELFRGYFFYIFLFSCYELTFTFFFDFEFGFSPLQIALLFLYVGSILIFTQGYLIRKMRQHYATARILVIGCSLAPVPLFFLGFMTTSVYLLLFLLFFITIGRGLSEASFTGLATLLADEENQGSVLGLFRGSGSLGRALGPICGSVLYFTFGPQYCYMILSTLLAVHVLVALPSRLDHRLEEQSVELT